ncbi:MAG: ATP-binding cassette domain-containing protein [Actinobacteria bacterium]|nr:ATP-binding cassette domain-containing protein [Actinomycetota bacterium]
MNDVTLLDARGITKRFAGITALDNVSLTVDAGEAVGLIGPNGAGKTTFFNCLLGMLKPDSGRVHFDGTNITRHPVHTRARLGFGRTFQRIELFGGMTVREHLLVAERARLGTGRLWKDCLNLSRPTEDELGRAQATLTLLGLDDVGDKRIEALSLGRARLVELGRALMTEPKLLLLDEPSSGLDQHETQEVVQMLQEVQRERGTAILLVEHDIGMVQAFAKRLYVLDFGTLIAQGPTADVMKDGAVQHAYLGEHGTTHAEDTESTNAAVTTSGAEATAAGAPGRPLLEMKDVDAAYGPFRALFGVSFSLPEKSVTALLSGNGAGKTTIARVITGLVPVTDGEVIFDGATITGMPPWDIALRGVVHAPEGRSVFSSLTVEENLTLDFRRNLGRHAVAGGLERAFELFPRLGERRTQLAGTLSGGEQRMLALARVLVRPPRLLIVDELSLGLAPIVVDEVYATLEKVRQTGTTLLIIEQYVGHALRIADSVVLLKHGEVVYDGSVAELGDVSERLLAIQGTEAHR